MRLRTRADDELGVLLVTATGAVDDHSSVALRRVFGAARAAGHVRVVVDLTSLDDVDPALATAFLEQDELLTARGGWLWLVHGSAELGTALRSARVTTPVRTSPRVLVGRH
jgi:anti-anti-sigma regulatory factor